jgi:hypothetical protein
LAAARRRDYIIFAFFETVSTTRFPTTTDFHFSFFPFHPFFAACANAVAGCAELFSCTIPHRSPPGRDALKVFIAPKTCDMDRSFSQSLLRLMLVLCAGGLMRSADAQSGWRRLKRWALGALTAKSNAHVDP